MAEGFDISKYITAADIAAAVTAGIIAYVRNKPKLDNKKGQTQPSANAQNQASPTAGQQPPANGGDEGWRKYCDWPDDPDDVADAKMQYRMELKAKQLSAATGGAPSARGTFQGGKLVSATPTPGARTASAAASAVSTPRLGSGKFNVFGKTIWNARKTWGNTSIVKDQYKNAVSMALKQDGVVGNDWWDCNAAVNKLINCTAGNNMKPGLFDKCIQALGPTHLKTLSQATDAQCNDVLTKLAARLT